MIIKGCVLFFSLQVAEAKEKVNHFEGGLWNSFEEIKVLVRGEKL